MSIDYSKSIFKQDKQQEDEQKTSPRLDKKAPPLTITSEQIEQVEAAVYRVGEVISEIMEKNRFSNENMCSILQDYLPTEQDVSRLIKHDKKRYPKASLLFALRRVFGVDLNALADGGSPEPELPYDLIVALHKWKNS